MGQGAEKAKLIDVRELRTLMGLSGILFPPIIVFVGILLDVDFQRALSAYYHTRMYGLFVGYLFVVGVILFSYKGYNLCEDILGYFAGVVAAGVGLVPPNLHSKLAPGNEWQNWPEGSWPTIHFVCTILLIASLFAFSILFTLGDKQCKKKRRRNWVYVGSAIGIGAGAALCVVGILVRNSLDLTEDQWIYYLVLIGETCAVWSFSIAWLVKGQSRIVPAALRD